MQKTKPIHIIYIFFIIAAEGSQNDNTTTFLMSGYSHNGE